MTDKTEKAKGQDERSVGQSELMDGLGRMRNTGRTTRMLKHAKQLAAEGRAVYIVVDNSRERNRLFLELGKDNKGIDIETPETLGNLDWQTMTLRGAHPNCIVLADHHAIEDRFGAIVSMLHAYDAP